MTHSPDKAMQIEANVVRKANPSLYIGKFKNGSGYAAFMSDRVHTAIVFPTEAAAILDLAEKLGLEKDCDH